MEFYKDKETGVVRKFDEKNVRDKSILKKLKTIKRIEKIDGKIIQSGLKWEKVTSSEYDNQFSEKPTKPTKTAKKEKAKKEVEEEVAVEEVEEEKTE